MGHSYRHDPRIAAQGADAVYAGHLRQGDPD
jgi:hypothetical protein